MSIHLENNVSSVTVDLYGGAITGFQLKQGSRINPLNFAFNPEQMPVNNRAGAPYQGHFLCAGRWGAPSAGEINAGVPNHGEAANIRWNKIAHTAFSVEMEATAALEGLKMKRVLKMDEMAPVIIVQETFTNIRPLGRLYNIVQHPTLAAPFLDASTVVDSNAATGFDQAFYEQANDQAFEWPVVRDVSGYSFDLRLPARDYNSVYSFVVAPQSRYGWITAFSPGHRLLIGYLWKRIDYPWIHFWQHWEAGVIQYRGLEFGTAGIHQPFQEIVFTATRLFGEKTVAYIDAGESVTKKYFSFIYSVKDDFAGVADIDVDQSAIRLKLKDGQSQIIDAHGILNDGL